MAGGVLTHNKNHVRPPDKRCDNGASVVSRCPASDGRRRPSEIHAVSVRRDQCDGHGPVEQTRAEDGRPEVERAPADPVQNGSV